MTTFKNILTFCAAAAIFFTVAAGVLFVIKNGDNIQSDLFFKSDDGKYFFLGKEITITPNIINSIEKYLDHCQSVSDLLFPDYFTTSAKNTAMLAGTAVAGIVQDIYILASDFIYGNM